MSACALPQSPYGVSAYSRFARYGDTADTSRDQSARLFDLARVNPLRSLCGFIKPVATAPNATGFQRGDGGSAFKVAPRSSARDVGDRMGLCSNAFCNLTDADAAFQVKAPNLAHLSLGKRLIPYVGALRLRIATAVSRIVRGRRGPISFNSVVRVVLIAAPAQMVRIAAGRIIATMQCEWFALWRRPVGDCAGNAVRQHLNAAPRSIVNVMSAVTRSLLSSLPLPALIGAPHAHAGPESSDLRGRKLFHSNVGNGCGANVKECVN